MFLEKTICFKLILDIKKVQYTSQVTAIYMLVTPVH